jgi:putative nucleotidyltransferase with HDIG domain
MAVSALFLSVLGRNLMVPRLIEHIGVETVLALVSGIGAGFLITGILPVIERLFKVTTSMTLRELNDASHPLLRRLAQEAPGTYQHSLRIADMAEAAADAIGASALLCRVGAMYHDIGKINKPGYFVENQGGGPNRHTKLSPAMSLLIIVGHVKDGIEMAREFKLPPSIRQFIETHHGTTLVEYFYHAAKQRRDAEGELPPSEFEYRYPGPKPQTREAAILMVCDGVEGAARVLPEPTAVRIEQLVHTMAMKRLMDGQFDECGITLKELHQIEQAISKTLTAIYHGRIAYPSARKPNPTSAPTNPNTPPQTAAS